MQFGTIRVMLLNCDEITCTLPQNHCSCEIFTCSFFFWNPHRGNLWVNHSWMDITVAGPGLGEPRSGVATGVIGKDSTNRILEGWDRAKGDQLISKWATDRRRRREEEDQIEQRK